MVVLGGVAFSYERGTPVAVHCMPGARLCEKNVEMLRGLFRVKPLSSEPGTKKAQIGLFVPSMAQISQSRPGSGLGLSHFSGQYL